MAWLDRFNDFETDWISNAFTQQESSSARVPNQQNYRQEETEEDDRSEVKKLCDVTLQMRNTNVVGVIIAMGQKRCITNRRSFDLGAQSHLVSFTLRDTPSYFVNVTCWGHVDFISEISNNFDIGSVVKVKNARVQAKNWDEADERFRPWTPVSFQLNVSEKNGIVESYKGWDVDTYRSTLIIPTRPNNDYLTMEDINISGLSLQGEHVNSLAAIKKVGVIRFITTKTGKQTRKCEVILFDDTNQTLCLELWQNHADASLLWTPFETVLFMADVKITFSSFKSSLVATADSKTIFTMDPETPEARCLRQFLKTLDRSEMDMGCNQVDSTTDVDLDLNSISEVFTVQEMKDRRVSMMQDMTTTACYGVMYAMVTGFNLDTEIAKVVHKMCGVCKKLMSLAEDAICTNPMCDTVDGYGNNAAAVDAYGSSIAVTDYNIPVELSDHTSTVRFCYLQSKVAETLIGCQPQVFVGMSEEQRTNIKWQYLMEHCKVIFKIKMSKSGMGKLPSVQILSLEKQCYHSQERAPQTSGHMHLLY